MKGRCPPVTSIDPLLQLLAFFYIYAFLGWCVEIAFHAVTTGHLVNRGMLAGPVCPIYGAGMIAMVLCTEPLQESWLLTFLGAMVICTIIELLVGLVLRALFHTQWWDYSSEPFNIAGLICLRFSIYWGLGGAFLIKVVHPPIRDAVALVPPLFLAIICCALTAVMLADLVITVRGIRHLQSQNALLFDIEAQMRETTAAIGSVITERTLDAQEYLEPLQDRFDEWQSENREERAAAAPASMPVSRNLTPAATPSKRAWLSKMTMLLRVCAKRSHASTNCAPIAGPCSKIVRVSLPVSRKLSQR